MRRLGGFFAKRQHLLVLASVTTTAFGLGGCLQSPIEQDRLRQSGQSGPTLPNQPPVEIETPSVALPAFGHLSGDIGPARGVDQPADSLTRYDDGDFAAVEVAVDLEERSAMVMLWVYGPDQLFVPGVHRTFAVDDLSGEVQVTALGCTGQSRDVYDEFDLAADEVEVIVDHVPDAAPGTVQVSATARWYFPDEDVVREATSSFQLRRD